MTEPTSRAGLRWLRAAVALSMSMSVLGSLWAPRAAGAPVEIASSASGPAPSAFIFAPIANPPPPQPLRSWYGWQTLLVDAASGVLLLAKPRETQSTCNADGCSVSTNTPATNYVAAGVYGLGAPLIHVAHGRGVVSLMSFGLRVASLGLLVAGLHQSSNDGHNEQSSLTTLGALGILAMPAIDAALFAYDESTPGSATARTRCTLAPSVAQGAGVLSVAGSF